MRVASLMLCLLLAACATPHANLLLTPNAPAINRTAPMLYHVRLHTTQGDIVLEIHRDWSPHGADRFYNLVKNGYYDNNKVWRISPRTWAQFGINGDPKISTAWRTQTFPDDPRVQTNARGTIDFAFAVHNGSTTQVFINLRDNAATHDAEPFVPFGKVIEGMDVADKLYSGYGEKAGGGIRAGKQDILFQQGNAYWDANFSKLDTIITAKIE